MYQIAPLIAGLLAFAATASAADMQLRRTISPESQLAGTAYSWSGGYVGIDAGGAIGNSKHSFSNGAPGGQSRPQGLMGGIYGGYNLQLGYLVVGLEGDIQASGISGAFQNNSGITSAASTRQGWGGALRARFGYASDNLLLYVAGGVTYAQFDYRGSPQTVTPCCGYSSARAGTTIGAGAEYAIRENLIGRLEYRYNDFGKTSGLLPPTYPGVAMRVSNSDHIARIGIAYKFGEQPGSTVSKY